LLYPRRKAAVSTEEEARKTQIRPGCGDEDKHLAVNRNPVFEIRNKKTEFHDT
jgi:hypothetical protein